VAVGEGVGLGAAVAVGEGVPVGDVVAAAVGLGDGDEVAATGVVGFGPDATAARTPRPTPATAAIPSAMTRTDLPLEAGRVATCPLEHPTSASRNARSSDRAQDRPSTRCRRRDYIPNVDDIAPFTRGTPPTASGEPARARDVRINEGGITTAIADAIDIQQGGIVRATATDIAVTNGGIVLAQGATVSLDRGFAVGAIGRDTRLVQSAANVVGGLDATIDQSLVMSLVANEVTLRQPSAVGVLIAARVDGDVRPMLDWRGALVFGAVFAIISRLLRTR
jgi:hypothetical protein